MTVRACMFVFLCVALYDHCDIIQWYSPDHKQLSNQIFLNIPEFEIGEYSGLDI